MQALDRDELCSVDSRKETDAGIDGAITDAPRGCQLTDDDRTSAAIALCAALARRPIVLPASLGRALEETAKGGQAVTDANLKALALGVAAAEPVTQV